MTAAGGQAAADIDRAPAPPAKSPGERESFHTAGGLRLRVREWGDAGAPAIVLLHGLRGFSGTWRQLAAALPGYRLIAIDQRGRGDSDWDPDRNYYTDAYLADLEAIVDALALERFALIGHSMGGTTAYVYAARHPDRLTGLVIEDIAPGSSVRGDGAARIRAEMAALPIDFGSWADARDYWRRTRPSVGDEALEQRLAESLREHDGRIGWRYDARGISETRLDPDPARVVDLWPVVEGITTPTLVIRGGKSDFCPLDTTLEMGRRNAALSAVTVTDASHYVHDDQPAIFARLVRGFLDRVGAATRSARSDRVSGTRNGATALLEMARAAGADICFANPGTTELTLVHALQHVPGIRPVLGLFEGVCTGAADGYARVSGRTALTLLHLGPGFANGIANLHNARRAHSPIVNIIGDHATWHLAYDAPLTSDIESLAGPVSTRVVRLASAETLAADVAVAFAAANDAPGGVTTIIAPTDIMDAVSDTPPVAVAPAMPTRAWTAAAVEAAQARLLAGGARILLLGGNALHERGLRAARRIADTTGARLVMEPYPAIVTLGGDLPKIERQAYFPQDVLAQFGEAEVILAGARAPISYFGYEGQPSVLVDEGRLVTLTTVVEDSAGALEALADRMGAARAEPMPCAAEPVASAPADRLTAEAIVAELVAQLPEDAIISLEGSTLGGPYLRQAHRAARHRVMTNTGGAIGQGLPCAVGAAFGAPGSRIVSLQSDGSV